MVVFGKGKKEKEDLSSGENSFKELQQFSEELMALAKEIEERLQKKREIENQMAQKNQAIGKLRNDLFNLKEQLMEANLELAKLEEKRKRVEEEKNST